MGVWTEKKVYPKTWKFKYVFHTRKGRKGQYRIKAIQYAKKVSNNSYKLKMKGKRWSITHNQYY